MKLNNLILGFLFLSGCTPVGISGSSDSSSSSSSVSSSSSSSGSSFIPPVNASNVAQFLNATGTNVMRISVGGDLCTASSPLNMPCVSITICEPGTSNCQTLNNILLDTGSYGLRVFKSLLTINPPALKDASNNTYAECATFGIGADWGSLATLDIQLGSSTQIASNVPVQIIDSTFASSSSLCALGAVDVDPVTAGFNGILGVGGYEQDCGTSCSSSASQSNYYSCSGTSCTQSAISLANQVTNPVYKLPTDNNGIIVAFPDVASTGATSTNGVVLFGIGTQTNNVPTSGVSTFNVDPTSGFIFTNYSGSNHYALFDTGTNGFDFYDSTITQCQTLTGFFCPASTMNITTTIFGTNNSITKSFSFNLANTEQLAQSNNLVFDNLGFAMSASSSNLFIYGLPAHFGKVLFIGYDGKTSSLGSGASFSY